ncbi:MAG: biotin/lipoyl-binding protein [Kofleriaceae bacterium]|nr:biotin/lipoyl-binding protein [Kofleriaceae bacterium]
MKVFKKILIANRGEIAIRIMDACRSLGIASVAIYSLSDKDARHAIEADEAILLGSDEGELSYLSIDRIVEIARDSGVDAIHPGYGFLSENPAFAQACTDAGIAFIGPTPEAISALADKSVAKVMVGKLGIPTIPSFDIDKPDTIQYPVLLKASAGGGGKGMQVVHAASELEEALASTKRIAANAFGDDGVLIEQYIDSPRHIEVQILGDQHGTLIHLFERECSIQRRHQKIVEESPAPGISTDLRKALTGAALTIGKSLGYQSAGTVEFIVAPNGDFFFLEVNTRLQVEHTVTEYVTGIDIVREQIRIAQGLKLGFCQSEVLLSGSSLQCRVYAEDCSDDFMPRSGRLLQWDYQAQDGLRVDSGVESGSEVSMHYDPLLAKFVSHAPTRDEAIAKMSAGLRSLKALGVTTNRRFLLGILEHPIFLSGKASTSFVSSYGDSIVAEGCPAPLHDAALIALTYWQFRNRGQASSPLPSLVRSFRNSRWREERVGFVSEESETWVGYLPNHDGSLQIRVGVPAAGLQATQECDIPYLRVELARDSSDSICLRIGDNLRHFAIATDNTKFFVQVNGYLFEWQQIPRLPVAQKEQALGAARSPMPAKVVRIVVEKGQEVKAGEVLLVLEAMKMEHRIVAQEDGVVESLRCQLGDQVASGDLLVVVSPS